MLHIIWVIIKIILMILAIILGLILLLTLIVLFAPVRYKIAARFDDDINVVAKVRFLIVSVNIIFEKNEKKLDTFLRILGIKFNVGGKEGKPKKEKKKKLNKKSVRDEESVQSEVQPEQQAEASNELQPAEIVSESNQASESNSGHLFTDEKTDASLSEDDSDDELTAYDLWGDEETLDEDEKKLFGRIKKLFKKSKKTVEDLEGKSEEEVKETLYQKLEKKVNAISEKKAAIEKKYNRFQKFWNMKCTVKTREYIKKYLVGLVKHIAPKKIKGYVRYGFDEPCTTGQVTGYLSLMPFVYQKHFSVYPDFYEKVLEGDVTVKGRIILGYIARIVLKRYIWQTIKMARKI